MTTHTDDTGVPRFTTGKLRTPSRDAHAPKATFQQVSEFRRLAWRDAGVFEALLEGLIAEAAKRGEVGLSLVSIDSTTARAHHDAAGMHLGEDVIAALDEAAAEEEKARSKGAAAKNETGRTAGTSASGRSDGASGVGESSVRRPERAALRRG